MFYKFDKIIFTLFVFSVTLFAQETNIAQYTIEHLIIVGISTTFIVIIFAILIILFLKHKYTKKLKQNLLKNLKHHEQEINKLHNRLFLAADKALAGYWEWNLDSNYLYLSKGWKKFLGYKEKELENTFETFQSLVHPDDFEPTMNIANNYMENTKGIYKAKFRLLHKDKSYKWVSAIGAILKSDERIFFGFHIDIDDLTTTKETLIAQSKSAMMGEMIGLIAHQFKQPLNLISMIESNRVLSVNLNEDIPHTTIKKDANAILHQIDYLSDTIDLFRNFLKPDNNKVEIFIEKIIENSLRITYKSLKTNSIKVTKDFKTTDKLYLNSSELMQVFINIFNNSKDAFNLNKTQDRQLNIRTLQEGSKTIIEIEDNATGIPEDKFEKIFEPYFTTKSKSKGTGLGLYIVKIIIQEHYNGTVKVENTQEGAKFTITLPNKQIT